MVCGRCGTHNPEGANFCSKCRFHLGRSGVTARELGDQLRKPPSAETKYFLAGGASGLVAGNAAADLFGSNTAGSAGAFGSALIFAIYAGLIWFSYSRLWDSPVHHWILGSRARLANRWTIHFPLAIATVGGGFVCGIIAGASFWTVKMPIGFRLVEPLFVLAPAIAFYPILLGSAPLKQFAPLCADNDTITTLPETAGAFECELNPDEFRFAFAFQLIRNSGSGSYRFIENGKIFDLREGEVKIIDFAPVLARLSNVDPVKAQHVTISASFQLIRCSDRNATVEELSSVEDRFRSVDQGVTFLRSCLRSAVVQFDDQTVTDYEKKVNKLANDLRTAQQNPEEYIKPFPAMACVYKQNNPLNFPLTEVHSRELARNALRAFRADIQQHITLDATPDKKVSEEKLNDVFQRIVSIKLRDENVEADEKRAALRFARFEVGIDDISFKDDSLLGRMRSIEEKSEQEMLKAETVLDEERRRAEESVRDGVRRMLDPLNSTFLSDEHRWALHRLLVAPDLLSMLALASSDPRLSLLGPGDQRS